MTTLLILATFLLAGAIKGVIGLGLPSVSLAILTVAIDLESAMVLLLAPSLVTNFWQGLSGGHTRFLLHRLRLFLLIAAASVLAGVAAFQLADPIWLSALLGCLIGCYALVNLLGLSFRISTQGEPIAGFVCGLANGIFTGLTGSSVVPGVMYLQSLNLGRDQFVQAMGMLFSISTLALGVALWWQQRLPTELGAQSVAAVVPALAGMVIGRAVRQHLSEQRFRQIFFSSLLLLGIYIVFTSLR